MLEVPCHRAGGDPYNAAMGTVLGPTIDALYRAFAAYPRRILAEYPGEVPSATMGGRRAGVLAQRKLKRTRLRAMTARDVEDYFTMYWNYAVPQARKLDSLKHVLPRLCELVAESVLAEDSARLVGLPCDAGLLADELGAISEWPEPERAAVIAFVGALLSAAPLDRRLAPLARVLGP
jgi:hypothetical protein